MKKKKRGTFLLIGLVSSVFLLMSPTKTCADSTSTTAFPSHFLLKKQLVITIT